MDIEIGRAIKRLRQNKGVTQEQLGDYLGVSYQAVSKWETGVTLPDVTMLPRLALFFGVAIDDLFTSGYEEHFKRIDNMLSNDYEISLENFTYAERILNQALIDNPEDAEVYIRLAGLYNSRANRDTLREARSYEKAIELTPLNETYHNSLRATRGMRHEYDRLVTYYTKHVMKYKEWLPGYRYLAQACISDNKATKALSTIIEGLAVKDDPHLRYLLGDVYLLRHDYQKAIATWEETISRYPNDTWLLNEVADRFAKLELFDKAFLFWNMAYELNNENASPLYSAAFLYDSLGQYDKAIDRWERIIECLRGVWNITQGEQVDWPLREIARLKSKMSGEDTAY